MLETMTLTVVDNFDSINIYYNGTNILYLVDDLLYEYNMNLDESYVYDEYVEYLGFDWANQLVVIEYKD